MKKTGSNKSPLALMHLSFLFSGAGTLLLGPTLPVFAQHWHLQDSQSGLLIGAQFLGLFTGAIALSSNLRRTLLCGYLIAAIGFLQLALASQHPHAYPEGVVAFFILGVGLGQVTTTVNILSAHRYRLPQHRSSALSLLNATWSIGAVISPLVSGFSIAHASLFVLLIAFLTIAITLFVVASQTIYEVSSASDESQQQSPSGVSLVSLSYFFVVFFLYGGIEATLSGWLSTYTHRYTELGIAASAYTATTLWASFCVGRAVASLLLRYTPDRIVRIAGIFIATAATVALRSAHTGSGVGICAAIIGLGIAPFFPITFSNLIARKPRPRQAGAATANVGLGSAVFPYLTGILSTHFGSLQIALITPVFIAFALLTLCFVDASGKPATTDPVQS